MSFAFEFNTPKLPLKESKPNVRKGGCELDENELVKRQRESLGKLLLSNRKFKQFYEDFIQVNQEFADYSQAKKIQLLLLYYIKKYNDRDTPHARDCIGYIFDLNNQNHWLNTFDLKFVYSFAFNNGIYEIVNKALKEELSLNKDLGNENPLRYAVKDCNNEVLLWLLYNVLLNVNLKQFNFINDIVNNTKKCFSLDVVEGYKYIYYNFDNAFFKTIDLIVNRKDMKLFKEIIKDNKNNNQLLHDIVYHIFYKFYDRAIPFIQHIMDNTNYEPINIKTMLNDSILDYNEGHNSSKNKNVIQSLIDIIVKTEKIDFLKKFITDLITEIMLQNTDADNNFTFNKNHYQFINSIILKSDFPKEFYNNLTGDLTVDEDDDKQVIDLINEFVHLKFNPQK